MSIDRWTVRRSGYVRKDRWIALREDECVTAEGEVIAPYYVVEYPDWVHVVAFDQDNRLLLVRQYRHGSGEITLELPAGKIDAEDRDPVEAGARELAEETGCEARELRLLGAHYANPANQNNRIHTVLAEGVRQTSAPKDDPGERVDSVWVSLDEALRLARSGGMPTLFQVGSLLLALEQTGRLTRPSR
jgi:8-oxo-dGTP pyrophosphatase MutT (NUDIX family)